MKTTTRTVLHVCAYSAYTCINKCILYKNVWTLTKVRIAYSRTSNNFTGTKFSELFKIANLR
jgi:hypothetical protein